jgi:hypothetical protein
MPKPSTPGLLHERILQTTLFSSPNLPKMSENGSATQMVTEPIAGLFNPFTLISDRLVIVIRNS